MSLEFKDVPFEIIVEQLFPKLDFNDLRSVFLISKTYCELAKDIYFWKLYLQGRNLSVVGLKKIDTQTNQIVLNIDHVKRMINESLPNILARICWKRYGGGEEVGPKERLLADRYIDPVYDRIAEMLPLKLYWADTSKPLDKVVPLVDIGAYFVGLKSHMQEYRFYSKHPNPRYGWYKHPVTLLQSISKFAIIPERAWLDLFWIDEQTNTCQSLARLFPAHTRSKPIAQMFIKRMSDTLNQPTRVQKPLNFTIIPSFI